MLHPHVLVQCAQDAADHATRLKCTLGKGAFAGTVKRRALELERSAYRMGTRSEGLTLLPMARSTAIATMSSDRGASNVQCAVSGCPITGDASARCSNGCC